MNKMVDPSFAAKIYGGDTSFGDKMKGKNDVDAGGGNSSFFDMVKNAAGNAVDAMRQGEQVSAQAIAGNADITDVVQAVNSAEMTLQTIVSVRDRMVSAYQEIMRMPM